MKQPLPDQLDEISSVIGRDAMLALVAACGGTRIYIPAKLPDEHWLISALGHEAAEKLCAHFTTSGIGNYRDRGSQLDIPAFVKNSYNRTRDEIDQLDDGKMSARAIALQVGVTDRTVRRRRRSRRLASRKSA